MPIQAPIWTDFLSCQVCCHEFAANTRPPISLGCGHTICRTCLATLHRKQCPFDQTCITTDLENLPINYALLLLMNTGSPLPIEPETTSPAIQNLSADDLHCYNLAKKSIEELALYLKPFPTGSVSSLLSRPMQRKLVMLINCQLVEEEGRSRALRAARSLGERTVTELILQHQNPQQLSANLWAAVRARGCQFLGPAMQEEVLKLVLLALEDGSALSRKVLVMFVVQRLEPHFHQASKTSIGHVVQLLYRASCFKVSKREGDSSLMQLKEEFRTYEALRREHDAQIVQIATEAGLRIAPDQWSSLLYGDTGHKSHMQSIIDKLQTPQSFILSVQELVIALQRTSDPANLNGLRTHFKHLANIDPTSENHVPTWREVAAAVDSVKVVCIGLIEFIQHHGNRKLQETGHSNHNPKYKISMCRDLAMRTACPRGTNCTFAHSEEELVRYRTKSRTSNSRTPTILQSSNKDGLDYSNDYGNSNSSGSYTDDTSPMRHVKQKSQQQQQQQQLSPNYIHHQSLQYMDKMPSHGGIHTQSSAMPSPNAIGTQPSNIQQQQQQQQQMNRFQFDHQYAPMNYPPPPPPPSAVQQQSASLSNGLSLGGRNVAMDLRSPRSMIQQNMQSIPSVHPPPPIMNYSPSQQQQQPQQQQSQQQQQQQQHLYPNHINSFGPNHDQTTYNASFLQQQQQQQQQSGSHQMQYPNMSINDFATNVNKIDPRQLEIYRQNILWEQQQQQQQQRQQLSLPTPQNLPKPSILPGSMHTINHNNSSNSNSNSNNNNNNNQHHHHNNNNNVAPQIAIRRLQNLELRRQEILKELEKYHQTTKMPGLLNGNIYKTGQSINANNMNNNKNMNNNNNNNNINNNCKDDLINYWNVPAATTTTTKTPIPTTTATPTTTNVPNYLTDQHNNAASSINRDIFVRSDSILTDDDYVPFDTPTSSNKYGPISRMSTKMPSLMQQQQQQHQYHQQQSGIGLGSSIFSGLNDHHHHHQLQLQQLQQQQQQQQHYRSQLAPSTSTSGNITGNINAGPSSSSSWLNNYQNNLRSAALYQSPLSHHGLTKDQLNLLIAANGGGAGASVGDCDLRKFDPIDSLYFQDILSGDKQSIESATAAAAAAFGIKPIDYAKLTADNLINEAQRSVLTMELKLIEQKLKGNDIKVSPVTIATSSTSIGGGASDGGVSSLLWNTNDFHKSNNRFWGSGSGGGDDELKNNRFDLTTEDTYDIGIANDMRELELRLESELEEHEKMWPTPDETLIAAAATTTAAATSSSSSSSLSIATAAAAATTTSHD